jgi:hypothetical protein
MYKRVLPVFILTSLLFSCGNQQTSESSSDTTDVAAADTVEEGNTDGDIFRTDALENAISGETEQPDTVPDYIIEEGEEDMVSIDEQLKEVCGFSPDGKYFAFKQVESGDGYGTVKGSVYVIDVAKNEWATRPGVLEIDGVDADYEKFEKDLNKIRDDLLKKYGIENHSNIGYEYSYIGVNPNNVIIINEDRYVLDFKSNGGMIDLRLKREGKPEVILQKDAKVPASRGSVRRSRLNKAYELNGKIAVFVEYDGNIETGFENSRYYSRKNIVVTAVIPK